MQLPLISIITVTKNCATTIGKTLDSVAKIKSTDTEYIIIDGVSTDNTLDIVQSAGSLIDQLVSEPDTGIYNAMNKGIKHASGAYILFINGDDELIPEGFSDVRAALRLGDVDVLCAMTAVDDNSARPEMLVAQPWHLPFYNSIPHPSAFVSSALLKQYGFREDLRIASDYDLFLRLFIDRRRFQKIDVATALHRRGGASGNTLLSEKEVEQIKREQLKLFYPLVRLVQGMHRLRKKVIKAG